MSVGCIFHLVMKMENECGVCNGTGTCAECDGSGLDAENEEYIACLTCAGTGKCRECNGKGEPIVF
jgi:hypothetical protein